MVKDLHPRNVILLGLFLLPDNFSFVITKSPDITRTQTGSTGCYRLETSDTNLATGSALYRGLGRGHSWLQAFPRHFSRAALPSTAHFLLTHAHREYTCELAASHILCINPPLLLGSHYQGCTGSLAGGTHTLTHFLCQKKRLVI